ncbi:hypothetical protein JJB09_14355 [Rhizobium sp. KVB221]|uniref:Sulfotransferase family protein n=1 Tax=Rhizobium setariae TaxID=2801340 RepID=A0A936YUZ5_9HYPH|nr:hypothetical protein [Rhizobium setariae]MBL0373215.1 hypothetical protein [Rhizobium setariae]
MKTLYMHIGWRKTGSSAIQSLVTQTMRQGIFGNIVFLPVGLERQKLVSGDAPLAHHPLANYKHSERWGQLWQDVAQFVKNSHHEKFLISSELFSLNFSRSPEMLDEMCPVLDLFDEVRFLSWIRRQDQYMASIRVQNVKHGAKAVPKKEMVRRYPPDANYHQMALLLNEKFPRATFVPHLYERSKGVLKQFLLATDLDSHLAEDLPGHFVNSSVSAEMYKFQTRLNALAEPSKLRTDPLHAILLKAWEALPADMRGQPAMPMTRAERRIILEHFQDSNFKLAEQFGFDPAFFNPRSDLIEAEPDYNIPAEVTGAFRKAIANSVLSIRPQAEQGDFEMLWRLMQDEAKASEGG